MIRQEIIKLIQRAAGEKNVQVECPENKEHGDYSTNVAMLLKKNPQEIANAIKSELSVRQAGILERVEVKNGFINFFISKKYLQQQAGEILRRKVYPPKFSERKLGRINVESISANPTGSLHIGNGRNAFAGDVIANVLEKAGYKVFREYFINDAKNSNQIKELGKTALGRGTVYLNEYLSEKRKAASEKLKKIKDEDEAGYLLAQEIQKDTRDFLKNKLKIKFDSWIFEEKDIYKKSKIKKIIDYLKKKGLLYQKEGAWWLKTSAYGDEKDWVVVRETGEPTYFLSDIAYHQDKFSRGFDKVIDIWGADHQAHVAKMKAAAKILDYKGVLDILILQLVTLKGKEKISKRKGNIITLEELIEEIGPDVARWFYLQKSLDTHMEIDLDLAKEQSEKNPVYYVQYAHARICSILRKLETKKLKLITKNLKLLNHPSELKLIKELIRLPEIIEDTAKDYQVQRLPQYAIDLATAFHQFYRDCKVLSEVKGLQRARLTLVLATKIVLKNTLDLMGISAPEKM